MIPSQRALFDLPADVAYLNCAYMAPLMRPAVDAGQAAVARKARPWTIEAADFFDEAEVTRGLFGRLIGSDADGVAIVPSASYGLATAAQNLAVAKRQRILALKDQFPANVYAWQALAARTGARLELLERPRQGTWTEAIRDALDDDVALLATPHCHWTDGALVDLEALRPALRDAGAALVVDATQSLGAMAFDVSAIDPDFLVAAAYKWLLGPYSLGFLYVAPRHREGRPLEETWTGRIGSEDFARLVDYQDAYQPGARRFDMGERANFQLMPIARVALERILGWSVDAVSDTLGAKTKAIAARLAPLGVETIAEAARAPHYLGLRFPGGLPAGLAGRLAESKVYVSVRGDAVRVTPHLYNDDNDVDRLVEALSAEMAGV